MNKPLIAEHSKSFETTFTWTPLSCFDTCSELNRQTGVPLRGLGAELLWPLFPPWGDANMLSTSVPHYIKLHSEVIIQACLTFDLRKGPDGRSSKNRLAAHI